MEKKVRKKDKKCNEPKSRKQYAEELKQSYKSGIKYYEEVDKE